jgi:uncharacterized membrane protein YcaP (DUF421 family)
MGFLIRAAVVYLGLTVLFRVAGKRTLAQITPFDLVLLLIISETVQQALLADDQSVTNALLLVIALVGMDILLSVLKQRWQWLDRVLDDRPLVIVRDGRPLRDRMNQERVSEDDVMASARLHQGIRTMDEIAYAVLESDGHISVIPRR